MMRRSRLVPALLVFLFCLGILGGCGGGTTGTGGTGTDFVGRLLEQNGQPIVRALITVQETADQGVTDDQGTFTIESSVEGATATLLVEVGTVEATTVVTDLPKEASTVELELELQRSSKTVAIKKRRVTPRNPPVKPTTAVPTVASPTAVPTAEPTQAPAPTEPVTSPTPVTASPTPSSEPTRVPTQEPTPAPQGRTVTISGIVQTANPGLLSGATIGIGGSGQFFPLTGSGGFQFDSRARGSGLRLVVKAAGKRDGVLIPPLPARVTRAIYGLRLEERAGGKLHLELVNVQLIE